MSEKAIVILVRLIGFAFMAWGGWAILANAAQAYNQVDWTYFDLFLVSRIIPPILAILWGLGIAWQSRSIAQWLLHGLMKDE